MRQKKSLRRCPTLWVTVVLIALLSGCSWKNHWAWQHPEGLDELSYQQAATECQNLAEKEQARDISLLYGHPYYSHNYHYYGLNPYYPGYGYSSFHQYRLNVEKLFRVCMQAKGWQWVKVQPQAEPTDQ